VEVEVGGERRLSEHSSAAMFCVLGLQLVAVFCLVECSGLWRCRRRALCVRACRVLGYGAVEARALWMIVCLSPQRTWMGWV
jgi:hypothetical protein